MSSRPEGFQVKCGFSRIRALLGMEPDEKFVHDHYYTCERGQAEFCWVGGNSVYAYPLTDWPDQDHFWEMMKLLNSKVSEEELNEWAMTDPKGELNN